MSTIYIVIRLLSAIDRIHCLDSSTTTIGRGPHCGIRLTDALVSREHAIIVQDKSTFHIRDLGSRNGTHLDGRPIQHPELLSNGTVLQINPYRLVIHFDLASAESEPATSDDSTRTGNREVRQRTLEVLTPAQHRVFGLLMEGLIEKEVAWKLGISTNTVHDHTKAIYKALAVSTRGELISRWSKHRL